MKRISSRRCMSTEPSPGRLTWCLGTDVSGWIRRGICWRLRLHCLSRWHCIWSPELCDGCGSCYLSRLFAFCNALSFARCSRAVCLVLSCCGDGLILLLVRAAKIDLKWSGRILILLGMSWPRSLAYDLGLVCAVIGLTSLTLILYWFKLIRLNIHVQLFGNYSVFVRSGVFQYCFKYL